MQNATLFDKWQLSIVSPEHTLCHVAVYQTEIPCEPWYSLSNLRCRCAGGDEHERNICDALTRTGRSSGNLFLPAMLAAVTFLWVGDQGVCSRAFQSDVRNTLCSSYDDMNMCVAAGVNVVAKAVHCLSINRHVLAHQARLCTG
jgi:hypothetical protein